jgi:preprotein translocase subunit SecD
VPRLVLLLVCIGLVMAGCDPWDASGTPRFAIFLVDESIGGEEPPGAERVPTSTAGTDVPVAMWLKREGGMVGPYVAEAHVGAAPDGQPTVEFTLTPEGRERFAALTRANIGRRLAVVVNGAIVASSIIGAEIPDGKAMLSASYTAAEAHELAAELTGTSR